MCADWVLGFAPTICETMLAKGRVYIVLEKQIP